MSSAYELLVEKFSNFKQYIKDNAPEENKEAIKTYENMTDAQLLLFARFYLVMKENNLDEILDAMCEKTGLLNIEHREKLEKYLRCFIALCKKL